MDVGCGSGQSTAILAPFFQRVTGIDPSAGIIKEAKLQNHNSNVDYKYVYTAYLLPFSSQMKIAPPPTPNAS